MVESLLEIITERRNQKFYKPVDVKPVRNAIEGIGVNIIVNKLKGRELFPDRTIEITLT